MDKYFSKIANEFTEVKEKTGIDAFSFSLIVLLIFCFSDASNYIDKQFIFTYIPTKYISYTNKFGYGIVTFIYIFSKKTYTNNMLYVGTFSLLSYLTIIFDNNVQYGGKFMNSTTLAFAIYGYKQVFDSILPKCNIKIKNMIEVLLAAASFSLVCNTLPYVFDKLIYTTSIQESNDYSVLSIMAKIIIEYKFKLGILFILLLLYSSVYNTKKNQPTSEKPIV